ncbi:C-type lectin domain family 7 member A isoform X2 [Amia ocellicauda]|uniref:C-type lectin domain family 7 member A isoform X2 n=1 Tax=Amia ocellicauda TaxID=2972642 RepID=UPI003463D1F6
MDTDGLYIALQRPNQDIYDTLNSRGEKEMRRGQRVQSCRTNPAFITLGVTVCILLLTVIVMGILSVCFGSLSCWRTHDLRLRQSFLTLSSTYITEPHPCFTVGWNNNADWESRLGEMEMDMERYNKALDTLCVKLSPREKEHHCCPVGWRAAGNVSCYYMSTEKKTWESAKQSCSLLGARLVVIKHKRDLDGILKIVNHDINYWIGLGKDSSGEWSWIDGRPMNTTVDAVNEHWGGDCAVVYRWGSDICRFTPLQLNNILNM